MNSRGAGELGLECLSQQRESEGGSNRRPCKIADKWHADSKKIAVVEF